MWSVEVTTLDDDYKYPEARSRVFLFATEEEAVQHAVVMLLENLADYDFYHIEENESAIELLARGNVQEIWSWYESQEGLFRGEYVPETFSISIRQRQLDSLEEGKLQPLVQELITTFSVDSWEEEAA